MEANSILSEAHENETKTQKRVETCVKNRDGPEGQNKVVLQQEWYCHATSPKRVKTLNL
jgi:hypothetical protein